MGTNIQNLLPLVWSRRVVCSEDGSIRSLKLWYLCTELDSNVSQKDHNLMLICVRNSNAMYDNDIKFQGKSLSLICGALRWLQDHEQRKREELKAAIARLDSTKDCNGGDDFDWLSQQAQQVRVLQQRQQLQQQLNKILSKDEKLEQLRKCKEKVAIICMKIVFRHLGSYMYTKHGPEYFILMQVTGTHLNACF